MYTFITGEKVLVFLQRRNICLLVIMMMIISALFYYPAIAFSINNATLAVQIAETHPDEVVDQKFLSEYEAVCSYLACIFC